MAEINHSTIETLEAKLRTGDQSSVREFLRNVSRIEIPDRFILSICQLARRVGYPRKGIILLREKIVDLPAHVRPNAKEQVEYAACLMKLGGVTEARRILLEIQAKDDPDIFKYLAFTYIHEWNYQDAIPLLRRYLASPDLNAYAQLVGSLNLAAALVAIEAYQEAIGLLELLHIQAERQKHRLLLGNISELLAQSYIQLRQFDKAALYLEGSWQALKSAQPRYRMYLEKWKAVAALLQNPQDQTALMQIRQTRREASERLEWETVRDCDLHESVICKDEPMFLNLYFGTPYVQYRQKMVHLIEGRIKIPTSYNLGPDTPCLDLETATLDSNSILRKGLARHRLLKALAYDFYAPATVSKLFMQVFADERFHPLSSGPRVYELIRRLKADLNSHMINWKIDASAGGYKLLLGNPNCGIVVHDNRKANQTVLEAIQSLYGHSEFSLRALAGDTSTAHTTLYREIKRLVEGGSLVAVGDGKKTRYKLSDGVSVRNKSA